MDEFKVKAQQLLLMFGNKGIFARFILLPLSLSCVLYFAKRQGFNLDEFQHSFSRTEISRAVPPEVNEMRIIASSQKAATYSLDHALLNDSHIAQRATEFLYPIRIGANSKLVFSKNMNMPADTCKLIMHKQLIYLYECHAE